MGVGWGSEQEDGDSPCGSHTCYYCEVELAGRPVRTPGPGLWHLHQHTLRLEAAEAGHHSCLGDRNDEDSVVVLGVPRSRGTPCNPVSFSNIPAFLWRPGGVARLPACRPCRQLRRGVGCTEHSQAAPILLAVSLAVSLVQRTAAVGLGQLGVGVGALAA